MLTSDRSVPRWRVALVAGAAWAGAAGFPAVFSGCLSAETIPSERLQEASQELRVSGEFGLAVHLVGDSVDVRWLTQVPAEGYLEVSEAGAVTHSFRTDPWQSHHVRFPRPASSEFVLAYGSASDDEDRHHTTIRLDAGAERAPVRVEGVDSLYVVGDIHGEFENVTAVLRNAGLIDTDLRWIGGTRHLVALGDMMSRGMDVAAVLWLLYRLEAEAAEAGGRVHVVLGNHEIMVMLDDLRYVHPKEAWIAESYGLGYDRLYDTRSSVLGRWLASKPAILQVDDVLLAHGGVSETHIHESPESHADSLRTYMSEDLFHLWADLTYQPEISEEAFERRYSLFWDSTSVFWYRGYSQADTQEEELERVLDRYGASVHVVAHTPVPGIREAFGGRLILTNTAPFADEVLLLVREEGSGGGWARRRIGQTGPPKPLIQGHPEPPSE